MYNVCFLKSIYYKEGATYDPEMPQNTQRHPTPPPPRLLRHPKPPKTPNFDYDLYNFREMKKDLLL